mgnify:CR=1 FL=1
MTRRSLLLPALAAVSLLPACGPGAGATAPAAGPPQVRTIRLVPEDVVPDHRLGRAPEPLGEAGMRDEENRHRGRGHSRSSRARRPPASS